MKFLDKVRREIRTHQLFKRGDTVILGVSGGADSTALLLSFYHLKHEYGLKLVVAHFNHRLRRGADKDELFVKMLSKRLGIVFVSKRWLKKKSSITTVSEDTARQNRFAFLIETAKKYHADAIALAHTLDDVSETVLMRVLRGSGLMGLRAILPKRKIQNVNVIRPLLKLRRKEIEVYLKILKQSFCQDPSNAQDKYFRNKIRLRLLPDLEKNFSPNIKDLLTHLADSAGADYDYIEKESRKQFSSLVTVSSNKMLSLKIDSLRKQPTAIKRMLLRLAAEKLCGDLNRLTLMHVLEAEDLILDRPVGSIVHWPQELKIKKEKDRIKVYI